MRSFGIILSALLLFGSLGYGQASWSPELQTRVKAIGPPRVSPDGSKVVYSVANEVMTAERSEYVNQIWLATSDGKSNVQITFGEKTSTNPKWSPDGNWIAFTSTRNKDKSNLYIIRAGGGEAEALTDVKSGVTEFEWSPDGKWIAFAMTDAKTDDEEKADKARNDFRWVDENIKMARLYAVQLIPNSIGVRELKQLTTGRRSVPVLAGHPTAAA